MNTVSLTAQGIELMLIGMGTVFVFLTLLVLVTSLVSALISRFFPPISPSSAGSAASGSSPIAGPDPRHLAAVVAAVRKHRQRRHALEDRSHDTRP